MDSTRLFCLLLLLTAPLATRSQPFFLLDALRTGIGGGGAFGGAPAAPTNQTAGNSFLLPGQNPGQVVPAPPAPPVGRPGLFGGFLQPGPAAPAPAPPRPGVPGPLVVPPPATPGFRPPVPPGAPIPRPGPGPPGTQPVAQVIGGPTAPGGPPEDPNAEIQEVGTSQESTGQQSVSSPAVGPDAGTTASPSPLVSSPPVEPEGGENASQAEQTPGSNPPAEAIGSINDQPASSMEETDMQTSPQDIGDSGTDNEQTDENQQPFPSSPEPSVNEVADPSTVDGSQPADVQATPASPPQPNPTPLEQTNGTDIDTGVLQPIAPSQAENPAVVVENVDTTEVDSRDPQQSSSPSVSEAPPAPSTIPDVSPKEPPAQETTTMVVPDASQPEENGQTVPNPQEAPNAEDSSSASTDGTDGTAENVPTVVSGATPQQEEGETGTQSTEKGDSNRGNEVNPPQGETESDCCKGNSADGPAVEGNENQNQVNTQPPQAESEPSTSSPVAEENSGQSTEIDNKAVPPQQESEPQDEEGTPQAQQEGAGSPSVEEASSPSVEEATSPSVEEASSPSVEEASSPSVEEAGSPTEEGDNGPAEEGAKSPTEEDVDGPADEEAKGPEVEEEAEVITTGVFSAVEESNITEVVFLLESTENVEALAEGFTFPVEVREEVLRKSPERVEDGDVVTLKSVATAALANTSSIEKLASVLVLSVFPEGNATLVAEIKELFEDKELVQEIVDADPTKDLLPSFGQRRLLCDGCTPVNSFTCAHCWTATVCSKFFWCPPAPKKEKND